MINSPAFSRSPPPLGRRFANAFALMLPMLMATLLAVFLSVASVAAPLKLSGNTSGSADVSYLYQFSPDNAGVAFLADLDVDSDDRVLATTDMLLLTRWHLGIRGNALIAGAVSATATRTTTVVIENYIEALTALTAP